MSTVEARIATLADVPTLLPMMEDFNAFEEIAWTRAAGEPALRTLVGDPRLGVVGMLEEGGVVVGYFVVTWGYDLEWNGRDAFLTELYLVPDARGRGLGKACLVDIERIAKENGARALHLMVRDENTRARRLYEAAGYTSPERIFLTKQLVG